MTAAEWMGRAHCLGDPKADDWFAPEDSPAQRKAISVCRRCPVRVDCGLHALTAQEDHGVWGGLTEWDRVKLRRYQANGADLRQVLEVLAQRYEPAR